ncbi:hypothetical protein, partial [Mycobacterium tuberculosis]|uniref:hypothetical protein n=1 Tax=Mycobacterium tuberculosis TaxID=1773 RepID=UPI001AE43F6D
AEVDSVKEERKAQEALAAELDAVIKGAGLVQLRAEEITTAVAGERRDRRRPDDAARREGAPGRAAPVVMAAVVAVAGPIGA